MFWLTIGAPTVIKAAELSTVHVICFVGGLYGLLVGTKITMAILVGKSRRFLKSSVYIWINRILGLVLLFYAFLFIREGLAHLNANGP
jgi:threonine/homoserine/homoserine lactone efflux protein